MSTLSYRVTGTAVLRDAANSAATDVNINLDIIETIENSRRAVLDASGNYLYHEVILHVASVYNPHATAYRQVGTRTISSPGASAPITDKAIREYLLTPRGRLVYKVGTTDEYVAPPTDVDEDPGGGPEPIFCDVKSNVGDKTFLVEWRVKFHQRELQVHSMPYVMSNTWSQTETLDESSGWRSVRHTRGRAIFDLARMPIGAGGDPLRPDDLRHAVIPKVLNGFRRAMIQVTALDDRRTLEYAVEDHEVAIQFNQLGVTNVVVVQQTGVTYPTAEAVLSGGMNIALNLASISRGGLAGSLGRGRRLTTMATATTTLAALRPLRTCNIMVKVFGDTKITMDKLAIWCWRVLRHRMRDSTGNVVGPDDSGVLRNMGCGWNEVHDPIERTVEMSMNVIRGFGFGQRILPNLVVDTTIGGGDTSMFARADGIDGRVGYDTTMVRQLPVAGASKPPRYEGARGWPIYVVESQVINDYGQYPFQTPTPAELEDTGVPPADPQQP